MSLLLENSPSGSGKILAKTFEASKILLHGQEKTLEIDAKDFCALVLYFLTNTDLVPEDPRLLLLERINSLKQIPGYASIFNKDSTSTRLGL